jgi:hypothetical protein
LRGALGLDTIRVLMKRSRVPRATGFCAAALAAWGCAQIAGVGGDYRLETGEAGTPNAPSGGKTAGSATDVPAAGTPDGEAGAGNSSQLAGGASGSGAGGTTAKAGEGGTLIGGTSSGGKSGSGGAETGGGGASGGKSGSGGAGTGGGATGGGSATGPVRVGFSEFHDSAWGSDNASSHLADATFSKPAGTQTGDLLLVFFGSDHTLGNLSATDLEPRGWTLIDQHENIGTDGQGTYLLYKFASATEPDPIVFTGINSTPSGNGVQGLLSVYRGVSKKAPVNAYEVNVAAEGVTDATQDVTATPAITTTADHCLLIAGLSPDSAVDAPVITMWPLGFTENQVSVNNPPHPYPYGWANIYSAEQHQQKAGTLAASSFTWKFSNDNRDFGSLAFVLALAPE